MSADPLNLDSLPRNTARPLVTFAVFAYNQEKYIREAIQGAFSQTYQPLEVILSDDCSIDRTFDIMQEMAAKYRGPHQVRLNRNRENLGIGGHVKRMFELSCGEWLVMAGGDDISLPDRTKTIINVVGNAPNLKAVFSSVNVIDDCGRALGDHTGYVRSFGCNYRPTLFELACAGGGVGIGASYAYLHSIGEWPDVYPSHLINEDRLLPWRACLLGKVAYIDQPLVNYRLSENGFSRQLEKDKQSMAIAKFVHIQELVATLHIAVKQEYIDRSVAATIERVVRLSHIEFLRRQKLSGEGRRLWRLAERMRLKFMKLRIAMAGWVLK